MIHIVLIEPQIPQNTGNIGRLCVATQSMLHLIKPLGFRTTQKDLKRAGLDYWQHLEVREWENLTHFWESHPIERKAHFFFSTKARQIHYDAQFQSESYLYFGREDAGIDEEILRAFASQAYRLPMAPIARSLNLATCVGAALYEALRQTRGFESLC
ncbi:tRNA (cytidine(34)-2'-O)-methyltransferase [uncultured Helicobacter sp.]|uniref:tRNA (cytidine(34)-2'-O)-methyltransferase n=1 Tax=uncultured Helicobacter sp. TaxID=175537 RepID=UPI001C3BB834|nr:tRNA (cytidine(34)-2'-O)-methyltransferase [Candidatus Helicobacter avicola]